MVLTLPVLGGTKKVKSRLAAACKEPNCGVRRDLRYCRAETERLHSRWQWVAVGFIVGGLVGLWWDRR
jgi:hypothetical protein